MVVIDTDGVLDLDDLTEDLQTLRRAARAIDAGGSRFPGRQIAREIEKHYILETLKLAGGNREEAARLLGIGERTLYRKIKEYQLRIRSDSRRILRLSERKITLYNTWVCKARRRLRWE